MARVIDQFSDHQHRLVVQIAKDFPDVIDTVKTAAIEDPKDLPKTAFAWPEAGLFPVHEPQQAVLSKLYAVKQASYVPKSVIERIDKALELYGVDLDISAEKTAAEDRDTNFLLPHQKRLVFERAQDSTKVAHALISQAHKLRMTSLATAATNFVKTAGEMGLMEGDVPSQIWKYAGMTTCDAGVLLDWIEARAMASPDLEKRAMFDRIAQTVRDNFPADGVLRDRQELIKMAETLERADEVAEIAHLYDTSILNPLETVFNMDKVASQTVTMGGQPIPLEKLMAIPAEVYEEVLGEDVMQHASVNGELDPAQFAALLQTLPADLQSLLTQNLGAYL